MNHKKIIILFLFSIPIQLIAQKDYAITIENDTIYGKIISSFGEKKIKTKNGKILISVENYKAYYKKKGKKHFEAIVYPLQYNTGELFFEQRLVSGEISLYESVHSESVTFDPNNTQFAHSKTSTYLYVLKGYLPSILSTNGMFQSNKRHKKVLSLISDNSKLAEKFKTMSGSIKNIKYILTEYNKEFNPDNKKYYSPTIRKYKIE